MSELATPSRALPRRVGPDLWLGRTPGQYLRSLVTPFNAVAAIILCVGVPIAVRRFTAGLAATTNLTNDSPWGLWIGFDVLCGVALAAGGFVIASAVHLFGLREYRPLLRPALLTGFLGYFFVVVGLGFDLGRPWRLPYPMFVSWGFTSVMLEVAWCVALYLTVLFLECSPIALEWLGLRRLRRWALRLTIVATALGLLLSTLHQSSLGGLFLIAPGKVHPLWYSAHIPVLFFVSAVAAGMSMVVVESMLSHRIFRTRAGAHDPARMDRLILGLGKGAAITLFTYFALKWIALAHDQHWQLLLTPYGWWWMLEVFGFVLFPCLLLIHAVRRGSATLVRAASVITILGVVLNRLNVSLITYRWDQPDRYVPSWMEIAITLTIVTVGLLAFRWIVNRMPVLDDDPAFAPEPGH